MHDYCYHHEPVTYGYSQRKCDDEFRKAMHQICGLDFKGVLDWFNKGKCKAAAEVMWKAVDVVGQDYFGKEV